MKNLENYGVQEMNANSTQNINGGTNTYPGGCSNGGGSQCESTSYGSGPGEYNPAQVEGEVLYSIAEGILGFFGIEL